MIPSLASGWNSTDNMQIDKITFNDISIFHAEEEFSIFHKLNFTKTTGGREWLRRIFMEPQSDIKRIMGVQNIIRTFIQKIDQWPEEITNGTLLMMEKFLDYQLDPVPERPNPVNSFTYRILHGQDFSMVKYSVKHFADFFRGIKTIQGFLADTELPASLMFHLERLRKILEEVPLKRLSLSTVSEEWTPQKNLYYAKFLRYTYRTEVFELIDIFSRLEAYYSMAMAVKTYELQFPKFIESDLPFLESEGLFHVMLETPIPYNISLNEKKNFMFLTGANMAGKSTLIKSVGSAVFLAHIGLGVPAKNMTLSIFDGMLTNINVTDNISKGESYFYNEVQRIKNTIQKINDGRKWLVLIDELFKGTNVQDAMKCSLAVIRGLIRIKGSVFILSTHLYEIGGELQVFSNIDFRYFETQVNDDQLHFSYQLKEGISNDRIGYVILRREKVVEMLEKL